MKILKQWVTNEYMLRYSLIATVMLFAVFAHKASRFKKRALSGQLVVEVRHLDSGNDFITAEEMRERVNKKFHSEFANKPMGSLSPLEIESGLKSLDFIKSADVFVDANNRLNVFVTQREPVLRLLTPEGYSYYVDKDGTAMPSSLHYSPRVLVAHARVDQTRDTLDLVHPGLEKDMFHLASVIREDRLLNALIEEIATDIQGEWTLVPKVGPSRIYIGNLDRLEEKILSLKRVYKEILPAEGWDKYFTVNLKYRGQVVCTKRA